MFPDVAMRVFLAHLALFLAIVAGLAALNLWIAPGYPWFVWVLMGWGAAVATHALALLLRKTHRRERIFIDKCARSFTVHLFAYLAAVLLLLFVNLTVTPNVWWFYWVALGWGAGLIPHGWSAFFRSRPRTARHKTKSAGEGTHGEPAAAKSSKRPSSPKRA
jgi:2TM domain-containing protein